MKKLSLKTDHLLFGFAAVVCLGGLVTLYFAKDACDIAKLLMLFTALGAVVFGWKQLKANHDWNRRSLTMTHLSDHIEKLRKYRLKLDELTIKSGVISHDGQSISFSDRVNQFFLSQA